MLLVSLLLVLMVSAFPAGAQTPVPAVAWQPCPGELAALATPTTADGGSNTGLECAEVQVPLDYGAADGEQIAIAITRLPATDPAKRLGNLVINPGGPGGSGNEIVLFEAITGVIFPALLREHFDLIGFDPRGVGASHGVQCNPELFNQDVSRFPTNQAEFEALVAYNEALGASCLELTGPLLSHIDTVSAARDIEAIRLALGGDKLNYLGLSYGTALGAQYAALHPDQIRVMALDGALDHDLSEVSMLVAEATAYEQSFDRFVTWCGEDPSRVLHGRDAGAVFDQLLAEAEQSPLPAPACANETAPRPCRPTVTAEAMRFNAQSLLLAKPADPELGSPGWNGLAEAIRQAAAGDASELSSPLATSTDDEAYALGPAIACLDYPASSASYEELAARQLLGRVVAPRMHGASQTWTIVTGCLGWPAPVMNEPHPANARGAPPILIINATHDPSTAYSWAVALFTQIEGSVLLTRAGDGHTSSLLPGPSKTVDAIVHYLITGETPPPNTVLDD